MSYENTEEEKIILIEHEHNKSHSPLFEEKDEPDSKKSKLMYINVSIVPILSDEVTVDIPLIDVIVGTIIDKKEINNLISKLPPMPKSLSHLKRVTSQSGTLKIIIGFPPQELKSTESDTLKGLDINSLHSLKVPSIGPITRHQFNQVKNFWSCNFHPDKIIEKYLEPNAGFKDGELAIILNNVNQLMENLISPKCLIYDPLQNETLICTPGITSDKLPLRHAPIVALDAISKLQGGVSFFEYDCFNSLNLSPTSLNIPIPNTSRNRSNDYLCTGFDVYLSHEPCIMCAMALLHYRVKRIFFVNKCESSGALGSICKLHCLPNINHRFIVFHVTPG